MLGASLVLLLLLPHDDKPVAKLPLGKETTYITGPLDKDGYLDYESALNDRLGMGISPETNANVLLWKALGPAAWGWEGNSQMREECFKRLGIANLPAEGDYFFDLPAYVRHHAKLDVKQVSAIVDQQERAGQRPWSANDYPHLAGWLRANEKPLALAVQASRRPDYFNPVVTRKTGEKPERLIDALFPSLWRCRDMASALAARAMLRLGDGKADEAWQDLLACHRLGRLLARGGTSIEAMYGAAIDRNAANADLAYLEGAGLTAGQVRGCLKDLRGLPAMPPIADKCDLTERFMYLDAVQSVRRGGGKDLGAKELRELEMIDWEPALRDGNRCYDRLAAALRVKDPTERRKEMEKVGKEIDALVKDSKSLETVLKGVHEGRPDKLAGKAIGGALLRLMMPLPRSLQAFDDKPEQVQRNLHLAFALAAYRGDHGRYPAKLDELAPKYLAAVPDDLFSGKPLVYRPEGKGYLLYSVGVNGRDDGGRWKDDDPPGDDLRVRMPLPELKPQK
ncbi:MAG TPA: hypothetical protein VFW33_12825 [Gemmataceae bacterium]|nr:hypothetical protein [Gemmataceae bacterium]